jgi:hypothetical protein
MQNYVFRSGEAQKYCMKLQSILVQLFFEKSMGTFGTKNTITPVNLGH